MAKYVYKANIPLSGAALVPGPDGEMMKPTVLDVEDVMEIIPPLRGHRKIAEWLIRALEVDKVNDIHAHNCVTPGPQFCEGLLRDLDVKLRIDNEAVLDNLPEGAFITVSNHHFGAMDGIILIDIVGRRRPSYKVMVNMFLNYIWALRPNFIAVDPSKTDDPKKRAVSMQGIREVFRLLRSGEPVGFFPAGSVAKVNWRGRLTDRQWQPTIMEIIKKAKVPVIPIFFHGSQSWWFNALGAVCWQARQVRHPAEVFNKVGKTFHISVGNPITAEEQAEHSGSLEEFTAFLRSRTYALREEYK